MKRLVIYILSVIGIFILSNKVYAYKSYKIGDEVNYNGVNFYVIKDSSSDSDYVTLLKAEPLTVEEVNLYGEGYVNMYVTTNHSPYQTALNLFGSGAMLYYNSKDCGYNGTAWVSDGCKSEYESSNIKKVVDAWSSKKIESTAFKQSRLITLDDLTDNLGYEYYIEGTSSGYRETEDVPTWISDGSAYWVSDEYILFSSNMLFKRTINSGGPANSEDGKYYATVRPVVELYKNAIENSIDNNDNEIDNKNKDTSIAIDNNTNQDSNINVSVPNTLKSVSGLVILIGMVLVCVGLNIFIIIKNKDRKKD